MAKFEVGKRYGGLDKCYTEYIVEIISRTEKSVTYKVVSKVDRHGNDLPVRDDIFRKKVRDEYGDEAILLSPYKGGDYYGILASEEVA